MDKFKDIKEGDVIYTSIGVIYGSSWKQRSRNFLLPEIVERTTKTQFLTRDGSRYRKDNGRAVGNTNTAYRLGETAWREEVKDETKEYNDFKIKIKLEKGIINTLESVKIGYNSNLSIEDLTKLDKLVDEIVKISRKQ